MFVEHFVQVRFLNCCLSGEDIYVAGFVVSLAMTRQGILFHRPCTRPNHCDLPEHFWVLTTKISSFHRSIGHFIIDTKWMKYKRFSKISAKSVHRQWWHFLIKSPWHVCLPSFLYYTMFLIFKKSKHWVRILINTHQKKKKNLAVNPFQCNNQGF